jgi:serine/threonine protein kinase
VNREEPGDTLRKVCPRCGKPEPGGKRSGSLTAYLFGGSECSCSLAGGGKQGAVATGAGPEDEVEFCQKCGLRIVPQSRDGTITGFLFQSTRCKCPPDPAFAPGVMSDRFWRLKRGGSDTVFIKQNAEHHADKEVSVGLLPGATIGGVYQIIELIGRGGMGEVYRARHEKLSRQCALKVIPPEQVTEEGWRRFQLEAKAVANLEHVNLVRVTDLGIHDGCLPYYAMDYVEGKNLAELLAEQGQLPLDMVLDTFRQVCDGLDCAHRKGILHRDLKPANIIVSTGSSQPGQAKILDFGLAKLTSRNRNQQSLTIAGDIFGSPFYMSPEQCHSVRLDNRSDLYSLGCTMFECLTGQPPFTGNLIESVMFGHMEGEPPTLQSMVGAGRLPPSMEIVIAKLLRKNPVERYQTCAELRGDLDRVARGQEVQPIYASRRKVMAAPEAAYEETSGGAASRPADHVSKEKSGLNPRSGLFVTATALFLIFAICSIIFCGPGLKLSVRAPGPILHKKLNSPQLGEKTAFVAADNVAGMFDDGRTGPISNGLSFVGGKQVRVFHFPADISLGTLVPNGDMSRKVQARGTVIFSATDALALHADLPLERNYVLLHPGILMKIGANDLFGLDVSTPTVNVLSTTIEELPPNVVTAISKWTGLRELWISGRKLSKDAVRELGNLASPIRRLHMRLSNFDSALLARAKWFNGLRLFDANSAVSIDPLLLALAGAPRLESVVIDDTDPSKAALAVLETCPKLTSLEMDDANINDDKLDAICEIAGLYNLTLKNNQLTFGGLKKLTRLKRLRILDVRYVPVSENDLDELRRLMPNCKIYSKSHSY